MKQIKNILLFGILTFLLTACSAREQSTSIPIETAENLFTAPIETTAVTDSTAPSTGSAEGLTDQEIFDAWQNSKPSIGGMGFGFYDATGTENQSGMSYYEYTGGELHVQVVATPDNIPEIGVLLFLDGQPQPYRIAEGGEYEYVHSFFPTSKEEIYDLWFVPVTGTEGDRLELNTLGIANPSFRITDGRLYGNHTGGCTGMPSEIRFLASSTKSTDVTVDKLVLEHSVTTKELTDSEYRKEIDNSNTNFPYQMSINYRGGRWGKTGGGDEYYGMNLSDPVQVDVQMWGDANGQYGLVLYVNNEPVIPEQPDLFQIEAGEKIIFHYTLDLSKVGENPVIYGVVAARNFWENGPGTGAADFSYEIAPAYLTEAKDLWDLLGIHEDQVKPQ